MIDSRIGTRATKLSLKERHTHTRTMEICAERISLDRSHATNLCVLIAFTHNVINRNMRNAGRFRAYALIGFGNRNQQHRRCGSYSLPRDNRKQGSAGLGARWVVALDRPCFGCMQATPTPPTPTPPCSEPKRRLRREDSCLTHPDTEQGTHSPSLALVGWKLSNLCLGPEAWTSHEK